MRIYLSGPITGKPKGNLDAFADAAYKLRCEGHFVINPAAFSHYIAPAEELQASFAALYNGDTGTGADLARATMMADVALLCSCDAIYLLKGWEGSKGAKLELDAALERGLKVLVEP